jgi:hypothetical protein
MNTKVYTKKCIECQAEFVTKPSYPKKVYCSISCSKKGKRNPKWKYETPIYICITCSNSFSPKCHPERKRKYCGIKCSIPSKIGLNNPNYKGKYAVKGENNPNWKGDNVGIDALHTYIRKMLPIPEFCQICNKAKPYDLANISNKYKRDIIDWEWLCRKCHMTKDGRLERLKNNHLNKK